MTSSESSARTCRGRRERAASRWRPGPADDSRCEAASSIRPSEEPLPPDCCGPAGSADASPSTARPCRRSSAAGRGCSVWSGPGRRPRSGPPERRGAAGETDPWSWRWVMQELSRLGLYIEEERCYQRHIRERRRQEITVQTGDITQLSKRDTHTLKLLTETTPPGQLQPHLYVTW